MAIAACEKEPSPEPDPVNPFTGEVDWNGFVLDTTRYETPKAFMENWGVNLDSLSSNFDLRFTDGNAVYDSYLRQITKDTIQVYFDTNSPSAEELAEGKYVIEPRQLRKPYNIVEAFLSFELNGKSYKYPFTGGNLEITKKSGYSLIKYELITWIGQTQLIIKGHYAGTFTNIDQRRNSK